MRADLKNGKTVITLHETDKRALAKARDTLAFVKRNTNESTLNVAADTGASAIGSVLESLCAETPEVDTPAADPAVEPANMRRAGAA